MSPILQRDGGYVYRIFSNEEERKHIHIIKAEKEAKFWLEPSVELCHNNGFTSQELKKITKYIETHEKVLKEQYALHISGRVDD